MQVVDGQCLYSPSDLTTFMNSPFASWMDRFALERKDSAPQRDETDAMMGSLQQKGYKHEEALKNQLIARGLRLVEIDGFSNTLKSQRTLAAMREGVDIVFQARLELGPFAGYADFLVKVSGKSLLGDYFYEVWDTKLSKSLKPAYAIQLCCYAEMLESIQGVRPPKVTIVLGSGEHKTLATRDFFFYYQQLKNAFLEQQQQFDPENMPDPSDSGSWGNWSSFAESLLIEKDHLFQVATITRGQIKKLNKAGILTVQDLIDSVLSHVAGMNKDVFQRLKDQATIQRRSEGQSRPLFKILDPAGEKKGLTLLPPHSPKDIFFDIEGYPLEEGGLEYLWGATFIDRNGLRSFRDFWAHDREQEKRAFEGFIRWAYACWLQDPRMHIYHYANYEIAACRKLMGRYGSCEAEVDQLLRNEVFVDLYKIVKGGLLLGEPRYSIKNVEHLYRSKRETDVADGGASIVAYEEWREKQIPLSNMLSGIEPDCAALTKSDPEGASWETSPILKSIRDYNIDDCDSTQELVVWLRQQQDMHQIPYLGKQELVEPEVSEAVTDRTDLRDRLLVRAEALRTDSPDLATLTENLAWSLEFHRRESKPLFWRLFDRLGLSDEELYDDPDCLAVCRRTRRDAFKPTPRSRNLAYEYRFDPDQEIKGLARSYYVLGLETGDGKRVKVDCLEEDSDLASGLIVLQSREEPPTIITLVPDEYVQPKPIPEGIEQVVARFESGGLGRSAILDFLTRSKPVFSNGHTGAIAPETHPTAKLQSVIKAVMALDNSYLTIQGPPGAGKSFTGTRIIAELVKSGAKVGVASNSHKAINHLMISVARRCEEMGLSGLFVCTKDTGSEVAEAGIAIVKNGDLAGLVQPGCVLGTTAWGFARDDMADTLDYLFVDEAGQVAVANLIAMSRAARNLVIMGDQMQLGQPSQGTHPAESGLSILDYLLHDSPTIADDQGVFLGTTYRMHSAVNRFVSDHVYEGKLTANPANDQRFVQVPEGYEGPLNKEAGIVFLPVLHEGNTQASEEEVDMIKGLVASLLGRSFTWESGQSRSVTLSDMLFVAPYNHQVRKLKEALGPDAKVGSVDKFQGQEAPIVFLSMCASDANESPRGMDFLFDKHRLNVAISRAQCLSIVVGNPRLAISSVNSIEQMALVNLFSALRSV